MVFLKICFWIVVAFVAFIAIVDFCLVLRAYSIYKERTLNDTYQKLDANVFASTYHLFPHRYDYLRPEDEWLKWITYTIITPGNHAFFFK